MKIKMTSRKVGFRWTDKNVKDFIDGFRCESESKKYLTGINRAVEYYVDPPKILKLRFCKEIYDQQREIAMQSACFSQGVAAAFYMMNSEDDEAES